MAAESERGLFLSSSGGRSSPGTEPSEAKRDRVICVVSVKGSLVQGSDATPAASWGSGEGEGGPRRQQPDCMEHNDDMKKPSAFPSTKEELGLLWSEYRMDERAFKKAVGLKVVKEK